MRKVLLAEFNRYFRRIFHVFSHLAIPRKSMEKALHCLNWYFDGNFTQIALLIKTFAEKSQTTETKNIISLHFHGINYQSCEHE